MQQAAMSETIVDHIKKDHQKTNEQLMELEKRVMGRKTSDDPVFAPMKKELLGHMAAEEKVLYPLLEKEMREKMQDAVREHDEVRTHLEHLSSGDMADDEWARHLQMMKQGIQHHVQEEEGEILPAARRILGEEKLRELGSKFKEMEEQSG
jgi:hemerythrin-like domain-containing protein